MKYFLFLIGVVLVCRQALIASSSNSLCSTTKNNTKCSYRISRLDENEYLIVKNILNNLLSRHWNITLEYLFYQIESSEMRMCDQYFGKISLKRVYF